MIPTSDAENLVLSAEKNNGREGTSVFWAESFGPVIRTHFYR
jgi:hypothetical protein